MKVLVDTSVWVDFFNGHDSPQALALATYLERDVDIATCGVVIAEFFQGLRGKTGPSRLRRRFLDMELLQPREPETYFSAADLFRQLRARGITVRSTIDCLVARLAEENDAVVLAKDRDMELILASGLCAAEQAPLG